MISVQLRQLFESQNARETFHKIYGGREGVMVYQADRYTRLTNRHAKNYGYPKNVRYFSAPGRIEIVGNHTDHNNGRVLAAAVSLDTVAAVSPNGGDKVRVSSEYDKKNIVIEIKLSELGAVESEKHSTAAVVRGVLARMAERGVALKGFDATVISDVRGGSGLSSSAAFEVLMLTVVDGLCADGKMDPCERARVAQNVENIYFGKPSGLMDQTASSVGGMVTIDFKHSPADVKPVPFDFPSAGYAVVVVNPGGNHSDLTGMYASIPQEMRQVAGFFGEKLLRAIGIEQIEDNIAALRAQVSDRAILRALHYLDENRRVADAVAALEQGDFPRFLAQVTASGESSWKLLQNVIARPDRQPLALALETARRALGGHGAWRVHGGGFEGTILCFVPNDQLDYFVRRINGTFGDKACDVLDIRPVGAMEIML